MVAQGWWVVRVTGVVVVGASAPGLHEAVEVVVLAPLAVVGVEDLGLTLRLVLGELGLKDERGELFSFLVPIVERERDVVVAVAILVLGSGGSSGGSGTVVPISGSTIVSNFAGCAVATRTQSFCSRTSGSRLRQVCVAVAVCGHVAKPNAW